MLEFVIFICGLMVAGMLLCICWASERHSCQMQISLEKIAEKIGDVEWEAGRIADCMSSGCGDPNCPVCNDDDRFELGSGTDIDDELQDSGSGIDFDPDAPDFDQHRRPRR